MTKYEEIINKYQNFMDHTENFHLVLELFDKATLASTNPILEVGLNKGGSSLCFLQLLKNENRNNWLFTVDPYGQIPYHNGAFVMDDSEYPNEKYRKTMITMHQFAFENEMNYIHTKATSLEFIQMLPHYKVHDSKESYPLNKFSFIHLDGSHDPYVVKQEVEGLISYLDKDGFIIVDDYEPHRFDGSWGEFLQKNPHVEFANLPSKLLIQFKK